MRRGRRPEVEAEKRRAAAAQALSIVASAVIGWLDLWRWARVSPFPFGAELRAYPEAAQGLVETGSPYSPRLVGGPIANTVANIPIA